MEERGEIKERGVEMSREEDEEEEEDIEVQKSKVGLSQQMTKWKACGECNIIFKQLNHTT